MTSGKAILVFCLSLLAVQAYSNVEIKSPRSDLLELFQDFTEKVESAINTALPALSGFKDQIEADAASFQDKLNATLIEATKPFIQQIEDAVAKATKAGVQVSDCVGSSKDDILSLPGQVTENVTSCVTEKVDEAKNGIDKFVTDVNSSQDVVSDITDQVNWCKGQSFVSLTNCAAELMGTIESRRHWIPVQITKDVADAKAYVATVAPGFALCDDGFKADLVSQAAPIVSVVTTCIYNKITPQS